MKLEFSWQIFQNYLDIKLKKNCSLGVELFDADRRTDRRSDRETEMTKLLVVFL